jgi:hypothetical protein
VTQPLAAAPAAAAALNILENPLELYAARGLPQLLPVPEGVPGPSFQILFALVGLLGKLSLRLCCILRAMALSSGG